MLLASFAALRGAEPPAVAEPAGLAADTQIPKSVESALELQVELHRRGFSCGSIDGIAGPQTIAALRAYQRFAGIPESGLLNAATQASLKLTAPALEEHTFTTEELGSLHPIPDSWLEKSELRLLPYGSALEMVSERYHANPKLVRQLNPNTDWNVILPGMRVVVPAADRVKINGTPATVIVQLGARSLEVTDEIGRVIARFPVSIARLVEKRPVGELHVTVIIPNPDYTFDPALFPESAEGRELGRRLVIPPGPNNPVGVVWIGLDRPGYGIHGTPEPEHVGRTESHGCFRLANWDALTLAGLVSVGMPVLVEP